jgi:hypothetical protein
MGPEPVECPKCRRSVISAVSLSGKRYVVEAEPIEAGVGDDVVILLSPSGTIRRAIPGDQAEHFQLHRCERSETLQSSASG